MHTNMELIKIKNPDGTERVLPTMSCPLSENVMKEAKKHFDAAESYRAKNWSAFSSCFHRACMIETCATDLDKALTRY